MNVIQLHKVKPNFSLAETISHYEVQQKSLKLIHQKQRASWKRVWSLSKENRFWLSRILKMTLHSTNFNVIFAWISVPYCHLHHK